MTLKKPLIIYHRGRHGRGIRAKENTIAAFERAITEGAAMIEFDVQADLFIAHDANHSVFAPTLGMVMHALRARTAVNIEIKSPAAVPQALSVIDDALSLGLWRAEQIVVSSFHHGSALLTKRAFPKLTVGVLNVGVLDYAYIKMLAAQGINNLHLDWDTIAMDIADNYTMRSAVRAMNMHIWVWTVNTKAVFDKVAA